MKDDDQRLLEDRLLSVSFLAGSAVHELNNPLAVAIANVDSALAEIVAGRTSEESVIEPLRDAQSALERLREIVRDIRLLSRTALTQPPEAVDVRVVLESALNLASYQLRRRARIVRELEPTPPVMANDGRLAQVLLNLLLNAAEALPESDAEAHEVRVTTATTSDGRALIEVADDGAGIAEADLPRIFDAFFSRKSGHGASLGLTLCRKLVAEMGGTIAVESQLGRGAIFRVHLPAASQPEAARPRRGRVLVIDDEQLVAGALRRILGDLHEITVAHTAGDAWSTLASQPRFDLILCDLNMPEVSGIELYQRLTNERPADAERIIFLTGGAYTNSVRSFLAAVNRPYIDKPFDVVRLRALVNDWIR